MRTKKAIPITERTFVRSAVFENAEHKITWVAQPYISGMYLAIEDSQVSQSIQLCSSHKKYAKMCKKFTKDRVQEGYTHVLEEAKYIDYVKEEELKKYYTF